MRRRGTSALLVATLLGTALLLLTAIGPAKAEDCPPVTLPGDTCTPTTVTSSTTTEPPPSSETTVQDTTSTSVQQTTTTRRRTTTTSGNEAAPVATTTTTVQVSTSQNVLVPGDGTEGAESTTTTVQTATKISSQDGHDRMLIGLVIVGLLALALAVAVLTWRYWAATRPPLVSG